MATSLDHLDGLAPTAVGKGKVGKPEPGSEKVGVKVKAAIFFDGTGNNQNNITKRLRDSNYMRPTGWFASADDYASYDSYYSNVATLYFMHVLRVGGEHIASVYMEGIGTTNDGLDDTSGGGFGAGPTGIVARVNRGISDLNNQVRRLVRAVDDDAFLEELTVYVFGFSRGAAAARHFCARRATNVVGRNNLCRELGVRPSVVKLKFVGLFDTVSSFDPTGESTPAEPSDTWFRPKAIRHASFNQGDAEFLNDVRELHLNLDDPTLERVVHLTAGDEYRYNFSLTSIRSAGGKGYELQLPGAHSDVGGGYKAIEAEERKFDSKSLAALNFFRARGWFGQGQLFRSGNNFLSRRRIASSYQYVGLWIMVKLSRKANSGITFGAANQHGERNVRYIIRPGTVLAMIQQHLEAYALLHFGQEPHPEPATLAQPQYHWLRQHYLHLSWKDQLGFEYRTDAAKRPHRHVIPG